VGVIILGLGATAFEARAVSVQFPFIKKKDSSKSKPKENTAPPAAPAVNPLPAISSGQTNFSSPPSAPIKKAGPLDRAAVLRMDALAQAAFWNDQFTIDPKDHEAGLYLANALRALGRFQESIKMADQALLMTPDQPDLIITKARSLIAADQAFYAIDPLTQAASLKPKDPSIYSLMGVAFQAVKRYSEAQGAWQKALSLSPENPNVLNNMAMAKMDQGDFAGAEVLLRRATAMGRESITVRQNLALSLGLQGKMGEAEALIRRDLPPEQADATVAWLTQVNYSPPRQIQSNPTPSTIVRSWDSLRASGS
jgi:Flp pilus assembly protein TadD